MYSIKEVKNSLRAEYKEKRAGISKEVKEKYDKKICERIKALVSYRFADTVLMYAAINPEIDLRELALCALDSGKRLAFPRCYDKGRMTFHYITSLDELTSGSFGIPEPDEHAPAVDLSRVNNCLCLIPALVFDKAGHRIGYGKGFYDRALSHFGGTKLGVAYSDFILEKVPYGKYDMTVDLTVSEKGVIVSGEN